MKAKVDGFKPNRFVLRSGIQSAYSRDTRISLIGIEVTLNVKQGNTPGLLEAHLTPPFATYAVTTILSFLAAMALMAPIVELNGVEAGWSMRMMTAAVTITLILVFRFFLRRERARFINEAERFLRLTRIES
ncbi:MAG TPA: hypothetical protein PKY96_09305 [Flavobacteriales bacterium]|nr:hypothetical protein [Flavobacteriales bacterium]